VVSKIDEEKFWLMNHVPVVIAIDFKIR